MRRLGRRCAKNDRVVAIQHPLHLEVGLLRGAADVVARPFAERPFVGGLTLLDPALDDDFGIGDQRQAGDRALDHLDRLAAHRTGVIQFAHAGGHFHPGQDHEQRVHADVYRHRRPAFARHPFVAMGAAMLAVDDVHGDVVLVHQHRAIGAKIDPMIVRVDGGYCRAGTDVAPAIQGMPQRGGKFHQVDRIALHHVLEHRTAVDKHRIEIFGRGGPAIGRAAELLDQRGIGVIGTHAQGQAEPACAVGGGGEDAKALGVALDLIKQQRRAAFFVIDLRHTADFQIPVRTLGMGQLADGLDLFQPLAQVVVLVFHAAILGC